MVDATGAEPRLTDHEAVALAGEKSRPRDSDIVEDDLGVALAILVAEHREATDDGDAGSVDWNDHH